MIDFFADVSRMARRANTAIRRARFGLGTLPIDWPEFNVRAAEYFKAMCDERKG